MRVNAFRIQNFRSIVDSGWQSLSYDGITALVGQNESGKSTIIDAIYAFETGEISEDDCRSGEEYPMVSLSYTEIGDDLESIEPSLLEAILDKHRNPYQRVNISKKWELVNGSYRCSTTLEEKSLIELFPFRYKTYDPIVSDEWEEVEIDLNEFIKNF